jgi:hypothetical protein
LKKNGFMKSRSLHMCLLGGLLLLAQPLSRVYGQGAIIWNGPIIYYNQPGDDPTQAANQDRLTPQDWLTRGSLRGLFNAVSETGYTHFFSPADTEWAFGSLANWNSLAYQPWENWNSRNPPSMVGQPAVVHLIQDNIYLSLTFDFWGMRGPGFAYYRSTPVPEPASGGLILLGLAAAGGRKLLRRNS